MVHAAANRIDVGVDSADRVDRGADELPVSRVEALDPIDPRFGRGVAIAALRALGRHIPVGGETAVKIEGVKQRDPDAGVGGRGEHGLTHGVGVVVPTAVGLVMHVVKLTHHGDAGQRHLGVGGPGEPVVAVRIEPLGRPVHHLAPRPERTVSGLGP